MSARLLFRPDGSPRTHALLWGFFAGDHPLQHNPMSRCLAYGGRMHVHCRPCGGRAIAVRWAQPRGSLQ